MVDPTKCPADWEHNPSDVKTDGYRSLSIKNVWQNTDTGNVVIQFNAMSAGDSHTVEVHNNPEKAVSRFKQLQSLISSGELDGSITKVSVSGGRLISAHSTRAEATSSALEYMKNPY